MEKIEIVGEKKPIRKMVAKILIVILSIVAISAALFFGAEEGTNRAISAQIEVFNSRDNKVIQEVREPPIIIIDLEQSTFLETPETSYAIYTTRWFYDFSEGVWTKEGQYGYGQGEMQVVEDYYPNNEPDMMPIMDTWYCTKRVVCSGA